MSTGCLGVLDGGVHACDATPYVDDEPIGADHLRLLVRPGKLHFHCGLPHAGWGMLRQRQDGLGRHQVQTIPVSMG